MKRKINSSGSRMDLERSLQDAGRRLSTSTLAFHRNVAARLGLNETDHKCLDILLREGPMTAGALAACGGYTTGAVTGIVSRLAATGFVSRVPDPEDGRRVVVQANAAETHRRMWPLLQPMIRRMAKLHGRCTITDLKLVLGYLGDCEAILRDSARELAAESEFG